MDCPKCGLALDAGAVECPRCGIVIAKFVRAHERATTDLARPPEDADEPADPSEAEEAVGLEQNARAAALPVALLAAWLAVKGSPGGVRLLTMWVHESGHAVTAWVCGYLAFPGPWFTPVSAERSPLFSTLVVGLLACGGYRAWQIRRWFWVAAAAGALLLVLAGTLGLSPAAARQLIIFGGDGGSLVLGTGLMLTVYARADHPVRRNHLRWGLLVIGALALMDVYAVWTGPINRLPFGENENGLSDPSLLTEGYGWSLLTLIDRYTELAHACFALLVVVYVTAIGVETLRASAPSRPRSAAA
jgi:hypothetical protein